MSSRPWSWASCWPAVKDSGNGLPWSASSCGLGSKDSNCDGPPAMQRWMTRFARAGKCSPPWACAKRQCRSRAARAHQLGKRHAAEAGEALLEEGPAAAIELVALVVGGDFWRSFMAQYRVMVSCRLRMTRQSCVHAASSTGSSFDRGAGLAGGDQATSHRPACFDRASRWFSNERLSAIPLRPLWVRGRARVSARGGCGLHRRHPAVSRMMRWAKARAASTNDGIVEQRERLLRAVGLEAARRCIPRGSARRRRPASDAGRCAASACRGRGGIGRSPVLTW